jgi:phenylacetate-CoA ligase
MFETGVRQFRMAMSMVWGRKVDPANIARLIADALATLAEFGEPGTDVQALTDGPFADPAARVEFQNRGLRRTARRLAELSPFYAERFAAAGVQPAKLDLESVRAVPVTVKADLIGRPADFRCAGVEPCLTTRTTGTTGRPAEVWLSRYETELWPALAALSGLLRDEIRPTDCLQVNISSRATAAVQQDVTLCRLVGAACRVLGVVPPEEALDSLLDGAPTMLSTYPSYLAELVVAARERGLGPADFALRRIDVGGEVLSTALSTAARATFGVSLVNDSFGMTEVLPVSGRTCESGHLHQDVNMGLVEVVDLDTGEPAGAGRLGSVVVTPYYPYRECMPVFRYDTRDLVRMLPEEPLTCELAGIPATSAIMGKAGQVLRPGGRAVTARDLVEAYDALPTRPWPARFAAAEAGDRIRLTMPAAALDGYSEAAAVAHFADRGLAVDIVVVGDEHARSLRPLRCDLRETTFAAPAEPAAPAAPQVLAGV